LKRIRPIPLDIPGVRKISNRRLGDGRGLACWRWLSRTLSIAGATRTHGCWRCGCWELLHSRRFFNWTVNGRSILPMAPAVGILIARRLENNFRQATRPGLEAWSSEPCRQRGAVPASSTRGGFLLARAPREKCAGRLHESYGSVDGRSGFKATGDFNITWSSRGALAIDLANPR